MQFLYVYCVCVLCIWFMQYVCVYAMLFVCGMMSESCLWCDLICVCVCGSVYVVCVCVCSVVCVIIEHVMCVVCGIHVLCIYVSGV